VTDEGARYDWAPDAPEPPAAPDAPAADPLAPEKPVVSAPGELPDRRSDPPDRRSELFDQPPVDDGAALLRRAMGTDGFAPEDDDDPALWDDAAARRELHFLTRLGIVGGVCATLAIAYALGGGFRQLPGLAFVMLFVDGTMLLALVGLYLFGFFATVRRRLFGWLVLGLLFTPFVYSVWAAVTLRRLPPAPEPPPPGEYHVRTRAAVRRKPRDLRRDALIAAPLLLGVAFVVACFLFQSAGHPDFAGTACFMVSAIALVAAGIAATGSRRYDFDAWAHRRREPSSGSSIGAALGIALFAVAPTLAWIFLALS
jgi:hypothetical protein